MNKLNMARALSQIEGHDEDPTWAEIIANLGPGEDHTEPLVDVGEIGSSCNDQDPTAPLGEGQADQNVQDQDAASPELQFDQSDGSAPPLDMDHDDACSDGAGWAAAFGDGDQSPSDHPLAPLNPGNIDQECNGSGHANSSSDDLAISSLAVSEGESSSDLQDSGFVGEADHNTSDDPVPLELGDADPTSTDNDPGSPPDLDMVHPPSNAAPGPALEASAAEAGSNDDRPDSTLEVDEVEKNASNEDSPPPNDDPPPSSDVDAANPGSDAAGLDTCLQHFELLHRLAADYDGTGRLELKGCHVCSKTGKEIATMLGDAYFGSYLWAGIANFDPHSAETPEKMVDAVVELTAASVELPAESGECHLYAPMVVMRFGKSPGKRQESNVAAVLGLVAHLDGIADYGDRLPRDPDYVLSCGDQVQAFYLLDKPAKVTQVKQVAKELREHAQCHPATADLAHDRWVPGTFRRSEKGPEPVQVLKPWDGASRTSLADLCVALGLPEPKVPSASVGIATKTQPYDDEADFEVDPWPKPLGAAALHGLAGEFVKTISPHSEADEPALMVQFLTAAGNAIGRDPHARVEGDRHPAKLFAVIAGASSTSRKGVSLGRVLGPLKHADSGWAGGCIKSGLSTGEGLIHHVRDPIEKCELLKEKGEEPRYETVITDHGVEDKRLLLVEPELARTLRAMTRTASTLSAVLRQAWDGGTLETLTKASSERATGHHISLIGHITVDELRHCMSHIDLANGLANRLLFVCTKRARYLPEGGALSDEDLEKLVDKLRHALDAARKIGKVERDDEARALWAEIYPELSHGRPGLLGAATNRAPAQVLRLSLVYALLDGSKIVRREHLEAAGEVWRYCKDSAAYIFGDSLGNPMAEKLLPALRNAGPDGMSTTPIRRDVLKGHGDTKEIQQTLYHLRDIGAATSFEVKTSGRPATRWKALP